jgi:hypothetical protein
MRARETHDGHELSSPYGVDGFGMRRVHPKKVVGHAARLSDLRSQKS